MIIQVDHPSANRYFFEPTAEINQDGERIWVGMVQLFHDEQPIPFDELFMEDVVSNIRQLILD